MRHPRREREHIHSGWVRQLEGRPCGTTAPDNDDDRYPLSPRVQTLKAILAKDPAGTGAGAITAAEAIHADASDDGQKAPFGALTLKSEPGSPMTLGNAVGAGVRLIIWCRDCSHQVEPDPAEMTARYGAETPVLDRRERLVCSRWRPAGHQLPRRNLERGTGSDRVPRRSAMAVREPYAGTNWQDVARS
jgi:hypothetical protein